MSLVLNTNINSLVAQNSLTVLGQPAGDRAAAAVLGPAHQHRRGRRRRLRDRPGHDLADQRPEPGRAERQRRRVADADRLGRAVRRSPTTCRRCAIWRSSRSTRPTARTDRADLNTQFQQLTADINNVATQHAVQRREPARRHVPGRDLPDRRQRRPDDHRVLGRQRQQQQHRRRCIRFSRLRLPAPAPRRGDTGTLTVTDRQWPRPHTDQPLMTFDRQWQRRTRQDRRRGDQPAVGPGWRPHRHGRRHGGIDLSSTANTADRESPIALHGRCASTWALRRLATLGVECGLRS